MSHRSSEYLAALRDHLHSDPHLSTAEISTLIREHRDLIEELSAAGADLAAELGTPAEYAAAVTAEVSGPGQKQPQGTLLGAPYDFRGPGSRSARSRIWDPQDPRILQPRFFGLGWTLNLGAVAVKLGWIRPDDIDADVVAAIPDKTMLAAKAVPGALTGAAALALATTWRELPASMPLNYTLRGIPRGKNQRKAMLLVLPAASAFLAVLPFRPGQQEDREDTLRLSAMGTFLGTLALGTIAAAVADVRGAHRPGLWVPAAVGGGVAAATGVLLGTFRTGLRKVWQREGLK